MQIYFIIIQDPSKKSDLKLFYKSFLIGQKLE